MLLFKVGDIVKQVHEDEQFVITKVEEKSIYPQGEHWIENKRKLPEK